MKFRIGIIVSLAALVLGGYVFAQQNVGGAIQQLSTLFNPAAVAITGGTINGTTLGATTPSSGVFTSLSSTSGALNGTIGGTTPAAGTFTTINGTVLTSTGGFTNNQAVATAGHSTSTLICTATGNNCYTQILLQPAGAAWQWSAAGSGASTLPGGIYLFDGTNVRMAWDATGSFGFGIGNSTASPSSDPWFVNGSTGLMTTTLFATKGNCFTGGNPTASCGSSPSGDVVVASGATTETVNTSAVTSHSQIQLTFDSSMSTVLSVTCNTTPVQGTVSNRVAGTSFVITVPVAPSGNPACFSYTIVN